MAHVFGLKFPHLWLKGFLPWNINLSFQRAVSAVHTFKASDLEIELLSKEKSSKKPNPDNLLFGTEFSDHMLEVNWYEDHGWEKPRIFPMQPLQLHPAAKVLHYSMELFEGMKAYRGVDNKIRLFRPDKNAERMHKTAIRSAFPCFNTDELIECIRQLVEVDQEWVPYSTKSSLYIRPTMIGTEAKLGLAVSNTVKLYVITGPVGPYFPTGFKPVSLLADPQYVRSWAGGVGAYKMGSNYGPTLYVSAKAQTKYGCQQVLWLYGKDHQVTEVGAMNIFMYWTNENGEEELITPPLDTGLILPGVTRLSLLELTKQWDEFKVSERSFTMKDIVKALKEKRIREIFASGTACVVNPVAKITYEGKELKIPTMSEGAPLTNRLYNELTDIHYGRTASDWAVEVC